MHGRPCAEHMTTKDSKNSINAFNVLYLYEYPLFLSCTSYLSQPCFLFSIWMNNEWINPCNVSLLKPAPVSLSSYWSFMWWWNYIVVWQSEQTNLRQDKTRQGSSALSPACQKEEHCHCFSDLFHFRFFRLNNGCQWVKVWGLDGWLSKS